MMTQTFSFPLFVYGTLKQGGQYHEEFCRQSLEEGYLDIKPATTRGRLYELPEGYPAFEIPEEWVGLLPLGSSNIQADAQLASTQALTSLSLSSIEAQSLELDHVRGELFIYTDLSAAQRDIKALDKMEGFFLDNLAGSLYHRVLVKVESHLGSQACQLSQWAWIYHYNRPHQGKRLKPAIWEV